MWLCKIKVLKKERKRKRTGVLERKRRIKDSSYHPAKTISASEKERHFQKSNVELGLANIYSTHMHFLI